MFDRRQGLARATRRLRRLPSVRRRECRARSLLPAFPFPYGARAQGSSRSQRSGPKRREWLAVAENPEQGGEGHMRERRQGRTAAGGISDPLGEVVENGLLAV